MADDLGYQFQVMKSEKNHQYYWHLKSLKNGKKIAWSGEEFLEKAKCLENLHLVRENASAAGIIDFSEGGAAIVSIGGLAERVARKIRGRN